jgi:TPR repeat protein
VPQDVAKARSWYEKAAERGHLAAMLNLAVLYRDGAGGPKNDAAARAWLEKGAAKGDSGAMINLASSFEHWDIHARNPQTAARYLLAAARAGEASIRNDLDGDMDGWSRDTRRAVQELLATSGDYKGKADGRWRPTSRAAAKAYYSRKQ